VQRPWRVKATSKILSGGWALAGATAGTGLLEWRPAEPAAFSRQERDTPLVGNGATKLVARAEAMARDYGATLD